MKRTRDVAGRTALAVAALAVSLAGCAALSPTVIITPYPAADGVGVDLPGTSVKLRDFLVIGTAKGDPAEVLGSVINDGPDDVQISLQADLGASAQPTQTLVRVPAHGSVRLGPDQENQMEIPQLPVEPGAATAISAATTSGGRADLQLTVLLPEGAYAGQTPAPTTAEPSPTESPDKSDKKKRAKSTDSPDETPTSEPTTTNN